MGAMKRLMVGCCLAVACSACEWGEVDAEGARAALLEVDRAFAALSESDGYIEAYYRYSTDDVLLLPPGALPKAGREEIYRSDSEEGLAGHLSWEPADARVAASGDMGWTWGQWLFTVDDEPGAPQRSYGKYVFIWDAANGEWKMTVNIWNDSPGE